MQTIATNHVAMHKVEGAHKGEVEPQEHMHGDQKAFGKRGVPQKGPKEGRKRGSIGTIQS